MWPARQTLPVSAPELLARAHLARSVSDSSLARVDPPGSKLKGDPWEGTAEWDAYCIEGKDLKPTKKCLRALQYLPLAEDRQKWFENVGLWLSVGSKIAPV